MKTDYNNFEIFMKELIEYFNIKLDESAWNAHKNKYEPTIDENVIEFMLLKYSEIHLNRYLEQQ